MSTVTSRLPLEAALSLIVLSTIAGSAHAAREIKTAVAPPMLQDVKTPRPPPPERETVSEALPVGPLELNEDVPNSAPRPTGSGFLAGLDATRVHFDQPGDGAIWAAGNTYKASFDVNGATYIPFFGSRAPQNFPVHVRIEEITIGGEPIAFDASAQPVHEANRIVFDRGIVDEVYDLSLDSMEQSFVFERIDVPGELLVRLAVDTELARDVDANGLVFSGEFGSVRYSHAFSFDESGVRTAAPTAFEGDAITLRVSADLVAQARGALVIDPLFTSLTIDNDADDSKLPDVAYDLTSNTYQVVYELAFSASDHDVYSRQYEVVASPPADSGAFVDLTASYWANPKVANRDGGITNHFLTVAQVGIPSGGSRHIYGRGRTAETTAQGLPFLISWGNGDKHNPDVGGDPTSGSQYHCVVWQRDATSTDSDVHARLINDGSSTFGGVIFLENSAGTIDTTPAISKHNGQGPASSQRWNVSWTRVPASHESDLYAAQIAKDGTVPTAPFAVDTTSANTGESSPSSLTDDTPRRWLLTYSRSTALSGLQIYGRLMQNDYELDIEDLTVLSGSPSGEIQSAPSADCDGVQFLVAHTESVQNTSARNVYISTFSTIGTQLVCPEGHTVLASSTAVEDQVEIACTDSLNSTRYAFAAWHQQTAAGNGDIKGAVYKAGATSIICQPGLDGVDACPCGNAPSSAHRGCNNSSNTGGARLAAVGFIYPDTVSLTATGMTPTGLAFFMQGNAPSDTGTVDGEQFGDGVRCIGGLLLRLGTRPVSSGSATWPYGATSIFERSAELGDPIAPGTKRYYQVYYRDVSQFACSTILNITDGIQIDW